MAGTTYNVHTDYDWTSIPQRSPLRNEAPFVEVHSFILNSNQIQQAISNFIEVFKNRNATDNGKSFYENLYGNATIPDDTFFFPYFSDNIRQFNNNFSETFQSGLGGDGGFLSEQNDQLKRLMGGVASIAGAFGGEKTTVNLPSFDLPFGLGKVGGPVGLPLGKPGVYVETPMFYQFEKNDSPIQVSFILANTINSESIDKNFFLIRRLTEINRPFRIDSITVIPPRIYSVKIPGHRFMQWAFCSSFEVTMLGARRLVNGIVVPEGYQINMQFQSLTLEHAGFLNDVGLTDHKFDVSPPPLASDIPFVGPPAELAGSQSGDNTQNTTSPSTPFATPKDAVPAIGAGGNPANPPGRGIPLNSTPIKPITLQPLG